MSAYYDRDGSSVSAAESALLRETERNGRPYWQLANTEVPEAEAVISTVWLGLDHGYGVGRGSPLIFESMAFGGGFDQCARRYATEAEAMAGHVRFVREVTMEAHAFRRLCVRPDLHAALLLVDDELEAHASSWGLYSGDFARAVKAARAAVTS